MNKLLPVTLFLITLVGYAQVAQGPQEPIKITGTVLDQETDQPLEYATLVLQNVRNPDKVTGGITDANGKFEVETAPGNYNVSVEYISYKSYKLENQNLRSSKDLGVIRLALDVSQLAEVEVVGERTRKRWFGNRCTEQRTFGFRRCGRQY